MEVHSSRRSIGSQLCLQKVCRRARLMGQAGGEEGCCKKVKFQKLCWSRNHEES